jgi:hypothetical protein
MRLLAGTLISCCYAKADDYEHPLKAPTPESIT